MSSIHRRGRPSQPRSKKSRDDPGLELVVERVGLDLLGDVAIRVFHGVSDRPALQPTSRDQHSAHHFHTLALDGVYVPGDTPEAPPTFVRAPEPTPEQVAWLCHRVAERARRRVERRPWREPDETRQAPAFKVFGAEPKRPVEKRITRGAAPAPRAAGRACGG